jgi:hypothetical protein
MLVLFKNISVVHSCPSGHGGDSNCLCATFFILKPMTTVKKSAQLSPNNEMVIADEPNLMAIIAEKFSEDPDEIAAYFNLCIIDFAMNFPDEDLPPDYRKMRQDNVYFVQKMREAFLDYQKERRA